jgi:hypothetical protein
LKDSAKGVITVNPYISMRAKRVEGKEKDSGIAVDIASAIVQTSRNGSWLGCSMALSVMIHSQGIGSIAYLLTSGISFVCSAALRAVDRLAIVVTDGLGAI